MAVDVGKTVLRKIEVEMPPVPVQPIGSIATIQRQEFGITIEIPPAGLWKGSKGIFCFALLWNAVISIFIVVLQHWIIMVIMIPFFAFGVGLLIAAINMGRQHATIATADDLVMIVRHSPIFGKLTREWSASQIQSIQCGDSGMELNDVPIKELQIIPNDGKKFGCLSQLDDDELVWIAAELNEGLGLGLPKLVNQI